MSDEKNVGRYSYISKKEMNEHDARADKLRKESMSRHAMKQSDRGFHLSDALKAADELRSEDMKEHEQSHWGEKKD